LAFSQEVPTEIPISGRAVPELEAFDQFAQQLLRDSRAPGLSLAIVRNGRTVFARGYGYSRVETQEPVLPSTLFRANSVSKYVTNTALRELIRDGVVGVNDLAFQKWLPDTLPDEPDPRLNAIQMWHLFAHGVPWSNDRRCSFELARQQIGAPVPTPPQMMLHLFTRNQPLSGAPGQAYGYHNTNHIVVSRVIERASGMGYEEFVQKRLLEPLGIRRMRIGNTRRQDLSAQESFVYHPPSDPKGSIGLPHASGVEPTSHQLCTNEMQDGVGGWLASAPDMAWLAANHEVSEYRVSTPGRFVNLVGSHLGGGPGGWGFSVAMSFGKGNGLAIFFNGSDGTTEWAASKPGPWWFVQELRRIYDETGTWPEHDLRPELESGLSSALTMRLGAEALAWNSADESLERTVEVQAGEGEAWHLVSSALWLEVSQWSGTGPATITLRANRNGLWDGRYYGTLAIENAAAHSHQHSVPLSFEVSGSERLRAVSIRPQIVPLLDRDQELNVQFTAEHGRPPYQWRVREELPEGFAFNGEEARLTGVSAADMEPREITVEVTDAAGGTAIRRWMLAVNRPLAQPLFDASLMVTTSFPEQNPCSAPTLDRVSASEPQLVSGLITSGGTHYGDELIYEWVGPDGVLRGRMRYNLNYNTTGTANPRCIRSGIFGLSAVPAANRTGDWKVRVLYNRNVVVERNFIVE
jgi:N-acyl-D-amino-acid deacylase